MTLAAYHDLGGALGALARRADDLFDDLADTERDAARQLFLRLVTLGEGTEDVRRRVLRSELAAVDVEHAVMEDVIDAFGEERLLTFDFDPATREPTVEVAHEALIQRWGRLRDWLDASRDDVRLQRMLAASASEWVTAGRDPDFLLRGSRLAQFADWADQTDIALTDDEQTFLETSVSEESLRRARRRRVRQLVVFATSLVAAVMTVLAIVAFRSAQDARDSEKKRREEQDRALELALVSGAQAALAKDDIDTALALAVSANRGKKPSTLAQVGLSEAAYQPGPVRTFPNQGHICVDISPDGTKVLAPRGNDVVISDIITGEEIHVLQGHTDLITCLGFSPDGRKAFSASGDATIILWDVETGQMLHRLGKGLILNGENLNATFSPDGTKLLSTNSARPPWFPDEEPYLIVWNVETGESMGLLRGHDRLTGHVDISPDGTKALSGASDELILWDLATGDILQRLKTDDNSAGAPVTIRFRPDGRSALVRYMSGPMVLWDLETFEVIRQFSQQYDVFWGWKHMALSPDGRIAAGGSMGPPTGVNAMVLEFWNVETGEWLMNLPIDAWGVDFSPDGNFLLVGAEGAVRLWDLRSAAEIRQFDPQLPSSTYIMDNFITPDGRQMLVFDTRCQLQVFDIETGQKIGQFGSYTVTEEPLQGCPEGAWYDYESLDVELYADAETLTIMMSTVEGRIIVWDAITGQQTLVFSGHTGGSGIAFSPDGRTVLSSDPVGTLILWDVTTGQEIRRFIGHDQVIWEVLFSPDGRTAFSSDEGTSIIHWNLATGQEIRRFGKKGGRYGHLIALSADGRTLLSSGEGGAINVWDVETGTLRMTLTGHGSTAMEFDFSPDGRYVLSMGMDTDTILWDLATGEAIRRYSAGYLLPTTMHPNGRSFFTVGWDNLIHQWRIDTLDDLMAWTLANRDVRELTCTERALYSVEPGCDDQGVFPTRTPYPTPQATTPTPPRTVDLAPDESVVTVTPPIPPRPVLTAQVGEQHGKVAIGDHQTWAYAGRAGESLTIQVNADQPCNWETPPESVPTSEINCLDTLVLVKMPDGQDMNFNSLVGMFEPTTCNDIEPGTNTNSRIDDLMLPEDGTYRITVSGFRFETGGVYTLTIESTPPEVNTSPPGP
jgi:WD40 repeat protein